MEIVIKPKAFEWYKEELNLREGDFVRFFPRYGGCGTVHAGFSLGIDKETPLDAKVVTTVDGVTFFIEERDTWYFDGQHLVVDFNEQADEPVFSIQKS